MKKQNSKLSILLSVSLLYGTILMLGNLVIGCKTTSNVTTDGTGGVVTNSTVSVDYQNIANSILKPGAQLGTYFAIRKDPNAKPYFQAVSVALSLFLVGNDYDPATLTSILNNISVKELRTPEAQVAIEAALGIYRTAFGDIVAQKLALNANVSVLLKAFKDGIDAGLASFAKEQTAGLSRVPGVR